MKGSSPVDNGWIDTLYTQMRKEQPPVVAEDAISRERKETLAKLDKELSALRISGFFCLVIGIIYFLLSIYSWWAVGTLINFGTVVNAGFMIWMAALCKGRYVKAGRTKRTIAEIRSGSAAEADPEKPYSQKAKEVLEWLRTTATTDKEKLRSEIEEAKAETNDQVQKFTAYLRTLNEALPEEQDEMWSNSVNTVTRAITHLEGQIEHYQERLRAVVHELEALLQDCSRLAKVVTQAIEFDCLQIALTVEEANERKRLIDQKFFAFQERCRTFREIIAETRISTAESVRARLELASAAPILNDAVVGVQS